MGGRIKRGMLVSLVCVVMGLVLAEGASAQTTPTACPTGTPFALTLSAPSVLPYGDKQLVVVGGSDGGASVNSGELEMRPLSASAPSFSHTFTADDLWNLNHGFNLFYDFVLSKGEGPVQLTLTDVETVSAQSDSGAPPGSQCLDQVSMVVRTEREPSPRIPMFTGINPIGSGMVKREPGKIVYSGDGSALLAGSGTIRSRLHWTKWNRSGARATGSDWHDNCIPDCARGAYSAYPVKLRAYRPRWIEGYLVFTRVTVTYTGSRPPYAAYRRGWVTYRLHYNTPKFEFFWM